MRQNQSYTSSFDNIELQGKRILFACVPADGHFNPLVPLATHLKSIGCDVRWYTSVNYETRIRKLGIVHYPFHHAFDISGGTPEELFPERARHKGKIKKLVFDLINGFILRAPEYFEDIREIQKRFPFDVVVTDCMLFAIPFIRNILQVPVISIGVIPLTESSKDTASAGLGLTPPSNIFQRLRSDFMGAVTSIVFRKPSGVMADVLQRYGIRMTTPSLFDYMIREATLLLQLGTPGFEYRRSDLGSNIRFIGASLPAGNASQRWHDPRLDRYKKVILVTQGTVETDVTKLIIPTLEAFKGTDHLVIVTTGGSETENLRRRYDHDNIIIEDFIPFDAVMPMADVYVSNGGYGGITFGIRNKLPMVVAGIHEGKSEINARVGYFKIGINLHTERPAPSQIRKAVGRILRDPMYQSKIEFLSAEFEHYPSDKLCAQYIAETLRKGRYAVTDAVSRANKVF